MSRLDELIDLKTIVNQELEIKPPSLYKVFLNNDDYTPMDFVIDVLQRFFSMDIDKANQIMLTVHYKGRAVCGVFTADIAETKVSQVMQYAEKNEQSLLCTMDQA